MEYPSTISCVTRAEAPGKWLSLNLGEGLPHVLTSKASYKARQLTVTSDRDQPPARTSRLNPGAKEWDPSTERSPEENRCLFLTFSNGYPLDENQIIRFFTNKFGACVEKVYVHSPEPRSKNSPPLFGKVVFTASHIPTVVLCGANQTKFRVDGKPLWCKKFEPNYKKKQARGSTSTII